MRRLYHNNIKFAKKLDSKLETSWTWILAIWDVISLQRRLMPHWGIRYWKSTAGLRPFPPGGKFWISGTSCLLGVGWAITSIQKLLERWRSLITSVSGSCRQSIQQTGTSPACLAHSDTQLSFHPDVILVIFNNLYGKCTVESECMPVSGSTRALSVGC